MKTFERAVFSRSRIASAFAGVVSTLLFCLLAVVNYTAGRVDAVELPPEPIVIPPKPPDAPVLETPKIPDSPQEAAVVADIPDPLSADVPEAKIVPLQAPRLEPKNLSSLVAGTVSAIGLIYEIGDLDVRPEPVQRVKPDYPYEKRINGISGWARVMFVVDESGKGREPEVESASDRDFAKAALNAIRNWLFTPGINDGKAVQTRMRQLFTFSTGH